MNISASEIVLIAILALVLFGPKRLPEIGRQVGRAISEVRRVSKEFEREVRDAVEPMEREVRGAIEPIQKEVMDAEAAARKTYEIDQDFSTFKPKPPDTPPEPTVGT